ncbi:MAG: response regulator, partial [Bdellovibrionales bacterium]|nr:response regulator [Bdellovibrionales bacterium]
TELNQNNPNPGRGQWVLVVEDESDLLDLETSMLEGMGYNVIQASSGKRALQVFQELGNKIELVISDNSLPGISGLEVFKELRKINRQIPLILTSGLGEEELRQESQDAAIQVDHYLSKPFTHQELGETLQRVLASHSKSTTTAEHH